jgi:hypothetical protein
MKKYIITMVALVVFAANANAQKKQQFAWNKKIMTEVGLSAEQQAKVDSIKSASNAEMQVVKSDATLAEDVKKSKLQEMQKKRLATIDAVLSDEQKKKAEEIKARIKAESATPE